MKSDVMKNLWQKFDRSFLRGQKLSRVLVVMITIWLFLATSLVGLSLNTSWRLEELGMAINEAGSLRKRVFYMVLVTKTPGIEQQFVHEQRQFEAILGRLRQLHEAGFVNGLRHRQLLAQVVKVEAQLQVFLSDREAYLQGRLNDAAFLAQAQEFTAVIDKLVLLIEQDNTHNIRLLRWLQALLLVMAVVSAIVSLVLLHHLVIVPLLRLNQGISQIGKGFFDTRLQLGTANEFGQVADGFNLMAAKLYEVYDTLENRVAEQTQAVVKRNRELAVLYAMTSLFQEQHDLSVLVQVFMHKMKAFSGADACVVQLKNRHSQMLEVAGSDGLTEEQVDRFRDYRCDGGHCTQLLQSGQMITNEQLQIHAANDGCCQMRQTLPFCLTFAVKSVEDEIGMLHLFALVPFTLSEENQRLISTVCSQFGIAIESMRLNELDKQMAILEERNLMAQGLHDSIAQSLSFMNMQVQVLEKALSEQKEEQAAQTLDFIHEGIQQCYDDVRELLSNFRVRLVSEGLISSLQGVMKRFEQQTDIAVDWSVEGDVYEVESDVQLQVVFIVQEALSNVRKHAQANAVRVRLAYMADRLNLWIEDNGVGFAENTLEQKGQQGHVGIHIMKERAGKINGQLRIFARTGSGACVELMVPRQYIHTQE
jgi:two-component system, NarL family, nitrate/nitrite sensor histidine kinase NarX